jgi:ribosomal protein S18 acetylase RimI-like enzyme
VRLPFALDEALAFAARHPVGHLDEPTRRRLLTQLTSGPEGVIVLGDEAGGLTLVASVLDVLADADAPAELVIVGARPGLAGAVFADEVIAPARAFARAARRRALHLALPEVVREAPEVLARAGFAFHHETIVMRRASALARGPAAEPPPGWRWAPLDDGLVALAHAALVQMFREAPSVTLPPLEVFRRGAFLSPPGWQVLLEGDAVAGLVRLSADGATGEVRVLGRVPRHRGRGLGELLLEHGLRLLAAAGVGGVTLEVAATNERALALYRAFDFEIVERTPTFSTVL